MSATDPNAIVTVNVSTILAPAPSQYQQTGAFVSFGATTTAAGTLTTLLSYSNLATILQPAYKISALTWLANVVSGTITGTFPPAMVTAGTAKMNITGCTPAGFNGTFTCTILTATTFSYPLTGTSPGTATVFGQAQLYNSAILNAMASTFYAQGNQIQVLVLELGAQTAFTAEVTALTQWISTNPLTIYGFLLPDDWGTPTNIPTALTLFQEYESPESMEYFWVTIQQASIGLIPNTVKSVIKLIEAPSVPIARGNAAPGLYAEFTLASMFYNAMAYQATAVTRVSPMCFKYVYGVTPYPLPGNNVLVASFKTNNLNYIQTGAEGGIAFTNVYQGVTADGFDYFNWWWIIDWVQININLDLSNAIINGSNNPLAPLYYDQQGINVLEATLAGTMMNAGSFGMVNGPVIQTQFTSPDLQMQIQLGTFTGQCNVNAVPFIPYSIQNPSDYGKGEYDGLSTLFIPARGFVHILVQVVATDIVTL